MSVLQSLRNKNIRNPSIATVLRKHSDLTPMKSIVYCWIPGHVGISGNEMADRAAKEALLLNISKTKIPYTDAKHAINTYSKTKWQTLWNNVPFNKLRSIKPTIGDSYNVCRTVRREEVILARLRIGHTRLTHSFLLKGDDIPVCIPCNKELTVQHVLIDCVDFDLIRRKYMYFKASSLKELFDTVNFTRVIDFLKECALNHKM